MGRTVLYGRVAYEFNAAYRPTAAEDESNPADYRAFAHTMNVLPKVVVSDSLAEAGWNMTIASGPLTEVVARLKGEVSGEIWLSAAYRWSRRSSRSGWLAAAGWR